MPRFNLDKPITVGGVTIWFNDPPADYKPAPGSKHVRCDSTDPLFEAFAKQAEADGFTDTEFHNALGMYAQAVEKAEAEGKTVPADKVRSKLEGLADGEVAALADLATDAQLAALDLVAGHLTTKRAAAEAAAKPKEPAMTRDDLKRIQMSDEYQRETSAEDPLHKKVREGYLALYPPGSEPTDRVLNRGQAPGGLSEPETDPARLQERARLRSIIDSPDYSVDPAKQAAVREGYQRLYPGTSNLADHNRGAITGDGQGEA